VYIITPASTYININMFMIWLKQVIAAILEFFSAEMKQDKKASNADKTPDKLKNAWRERILEAERKSKDESNKDTSTD
jgi:hypothetical protein